MGSAARKKPERCYIYLLPGFLILPLSYMDFLIFVGEVIWALAGFLDLLQKNPLADFLMGGFLNARHPLYIQLRALTNCCINKRKQGFLAKK